VDKIWHDAFAALPDDLTKLANLIRCDTPMPAEVRNLLAELLAPGDPPLLDFRFRCRRHNAAARTRRQIIDTFSERHTRRILNQEKTAEKVEARGRRFAGIGMVGKIGGRMPGDIDPTPSRAGGRRPGAGKRKKPK